MMQHLSKPINSDAETGTTDLFLSHAKANEKFALDLLAALEKHGQSVWFDRGRMEEGDYMPDKINPGIERARIFLFVLSPESLASQWCQEEVRHAAKCNKRIITIQYKPINLYSNNSIHDILRKPFWIDMCSIGLNTKQFNEKISHILKKIGEDKDYLEKHTQFSIRALDWDQHGENTGRLLPRGLLVEAEQWVQEWDQKVQLGKFSENHPDAPTALQRNFIATSRKLETKRQRIQNIAISVGFIAVSVAGIVAFFQYRQADAARHRVDVARQNAETSSSFLQAEKTLASGSEIEALLEALRMGDKLKNKFQSVTDENRWQAIVTLQKIVYGIRERNRLEGHVGGAMGVQFSPDGEFIASIASDATVKLWRKNGFQKLNFTGHQGITSRLKIDANNKMIEIPGESHKTIARIKFSSDSKALASVDNDGNIKLWNIQGKILLDEDIVKAVDIVGPKNEIDKMLDIRANESLLGKTWTDGKRRWTKARSINGGDPNINFINSISFDLGRNLIAYTLADGSSILYNFKNKDRMEFENYKDENSSIFLTSDGNSLGIVSSDGSIRIHDLKTQRFSQIRLPDSDKSIKQRSICPEMINKSLGIVKNSEIELLDFNGKKIKTLTLTSKEKFEGINNLKSISCSSSQSLLAFSPDDSEGSIEVWDYQKGTHIEKIKAHASMINQINISPNGKAIASASMDGTVKILSLLKPELRFLDTELKETSYQSSVKFSPDGKMMASVGYFGVTVWNNDGKKLFTIGGTSGSVDFSSDGFITIASVSGNALGLYNLEGKEILSFNISANKVAVMNPEAIFSPDAKSIVSLRSSELIFWSRDGKEILSLDSEKMGIESMAFSPDGKVLVSGSRDGQIRFWNREGKITKDFSAHTQQINTLAYSPNGQFLISAGEDANIKLWSMDGSIKATLKGHLKPVSSVVFHPNGNIFASLDKSGQVKFWGMNGVELGTISHSNTIQSIRFSPDGKTLLSGGMHGDKGDTVILWNFDLDNLMERGCNWIHDYLQNNPNAKEDDRQICNVKSSPKT